MYAKVAPNIIDCRLLAVRFFSLFLHLVLISARMIANHDASNILLYDSHKCNEKRKHSS